MIANILGNGALEKALNVICSNANYTTTLYFVVIYFGNMITQVLIINGYTTETYLAGLSAGEVVTLYTNPTYPLHGISAIREENSVRTKIYMEKTNANYRAAVLPLGTAAVTGYAKYTAYWATS